MNKLNLILGILFCSLTLTAQINIGGNPISWSENIPLTNLEELYFPELDMQKIQIEDKLDLDNNIPERYAINYKVKFNMQTSGKYYALNNAGRIWTLKIKCEKAKFVNLFFEKFYLPKGCTMYIYSSNRKEKIGGFNYKNNKDGKEFRKLFTGFINDDNAIVEVFIPNFVSESPIIEIGKINHGYKNMQDKPVREFGDAQSCNVNINCSEGNDWQDEKKGVVLILNDEIRKCSGSLINNTAKNCENYLLTANHCLGASGIILADAIDLPDMSDWGFLWFYESKDCNNPSQESDIKTEVLTTGATCIANNDMTDFALLKLEEVPEWSETQIFKPYYNGWSRTTELLSGGVCIHHPKADIKKISTYTITPKLNTSCAIDPANWYEINWKTTSNGTGIVEKGSSGAPLFMNNKFIIGQLQGRGICSEILCEKPLDQKVIYGRFNVSWTSNNNGDNRRRLDHWLDPNNTNDMQVEGGYCENCTGTSRYIHGNLNYSKYYQAPIDILSDATILAPNGNVIFKAGNSITLLDGFEAQENSYFEAYIDICSQTTGNRLSNTNNGLNIKNQIVNVSVFPNPAKEQFSVLINPEDIKANFVLFDMQGKCVLKSNTLSNIDISKLSNGIYLLKINLSNNQTINRTITINHE